MSKITVNPDATRIKVIPGNTVVVVTPLVVVGVGGTGEGDMVLALPQTVTGKKTFTVTALAVKGTGTGSTTISTANTSANPYTATLPAKDGTIAMTDDIPSTTGMLTESGVQSVTGAKTFDSSALKVKGSSTGVTTIASATADGSNYTQTLPAKDGTIAMTDDIPTVTGTNTGDETGDRISLIIVTSSTKTTPADNDLIPLSDSADSWHLKGLSWSNVKAKLKTYFDTLYGAGDMLLGTVQSVTGLKTFSKDKLAMKGTSTGKTVISTANTSATDYTATLPAKDGTIAMTDDIPTVTGTNTGDETSARIATIIDGVAAKTSMADADKVTIIDTEASNSLKTLSWSYVKSILKTYFDTLYGAGNMILASIQSVTGLKTFDKDKLAMKGTSTGTTTISTANTGATNYTQVLPAKDGTFAMTSDITDGSGDMVLDSFQLVTGLKVFDKLKLALIGTGSGKTMFTTANDSETETTVTFPNKSGTVAMLDDVTAAAGDVTGPSGATGDDIAIFDGATGKVIKDGGKKLSDLVQLDSEATVTHTKGSASSTVGASETLRSTPGTVASPTATQIGDLLGEYRFGGRKATAWSAAVASIKAFAGQTFNDTQNGTDLKFYTCQGNSTTLTEAMSISQWQKVGIGVSGGTAWLHLKAGAATSGQAPLKFEAGTNLTNPEAGAVEWNGTNMFVTQTSGPTRKTLAFTTDIKDTNVAFSDVTTNDAGTTTHGFAPKATAPAANALSVVGITNGETQYSNKALLDTTTPSTQAFGDSASAGTSLKAAHVDHKHAMPAAPTTVSGSSGSVKSPSTTGVIKFTGMGAGTNRTKTVTDGDDTVMELGATQSVTGAKTFDSSALKVKGSSTGVTTIASENAGTSNYTQTLPAKAGTFAMTSDIPTVTGTNTGDETATRVATIINAVSAKTSMADADKVTIIDTEASNSLKTLSWTYVKSVLKTYFDTLYSVKAGSSSIVTVGTLSAGNATGVVDAASESSAGKIEIATLAEVNTGTDNTRSVTPDGLAGSVFGTKAITVQVIDGTTALATGDGKAYFRVPSSLNGMNLVEAHAQVVVKSTSNRPTFMVTRGRQANATSDFTYVDMLSTAITIDENEYDSKDATTAPVINGSNDDVATGDVIRLDCDATGTGTKGWNLSLLFRLP